MKRLLEITDSDLGLKVKSEVKYTKRVAARAILRKGKLIALLNVSKQNYYKLPGGGVDEGESIEGGLNREMLEEVGCSVQILGEVGEIVELRSQWNLSQTSYCFLAEVAKEGKQDFTAEELEDGFTLVWVSLDRAIDLLKESKPLTYDGKFIVRRDLEFLQEAKKSFN